MDVFNYSSTGFDIPKIECASSLGMENGKIPDSAIVASSRHNQYWVPERGRLNEKKEGNSSASRVFRLWCRLFPCNCPLCHARQMYCVFHIIDNTLQYAGQGLRLNVTETPIAPCSVQKGTWTITSHLFLTLCQMPVYKFSFVGQCSFFQFNLNNVQSLV